MAKVTFLGTAASIPTVKRDNTSFLFTHKKEVFLIDCPGAIVQKLLKAGEDFKKLQNVIITHQHPDHIYGIISLIHTQAYLNDTLNIFSNQTCIKIVQQLVKIFRLGREHFPKINYINVYKSRPFYRRGDLTLHAVKNAHVPASFGVKFTFGRKSLLYTSDTRLSPGLLKPPRPDYLIHDCTASSSYFRQHPALYKMHTDAKTLAARLKRDLDTKFIPIHFLLLQPGEEKRIREELKPLGKKVIFVRDFQTLDL